MSNYRTEARTETQKMYGAYCTWCSQLEILPVPYHSFNIKVYEETKQKRKLQITEK